MEPTLKAKWLEALRSGKYEQSRACLRDPKGFCCLGVLCDISELGKWGHVISAHRYGADKRLFPFLASGSSAVIYLPGAVTAEAGLSLPQVKHLATLNDAEGFNFPEIADYIEAHL